MSEFGWAWTAWLTVGAAMEAWFLWGRRQPGDTLSERIRHWLAYGPEDEPTPLVWAMRGLLLAGLVWLIPHWLL